MISLLKRIWRSWEITDSVSALLTVLGWKGAVLTLIASAGFGYWAWSEELGHLPTGLIALHVFVLMLLAANAIDARRARDRPSKAKQTFDYSYGLHLANVDVVRGDGEELDLVEVKIILYNATEYPMRLSVDDMLVILGTTTYPYPKYNLSETVVPSRCYIGFAFPPFNVTTFPANVKGTVRYSVRYGHPSGDYLRSHSKEVFLNVHLPGAPRAGYTLLKERDEALG